MTGVPVADAFVYHLRYHLQMTEQTTIAFNNTLFQFSSALIQLQRTQQLMKENDEKHFTALKQSEDRNAHLMQDYNDLYLRYCRSLDKEERLQQQIAELQKEIDMKEDAIKYLVQNVEGSEGGYLNTLDNEQEEASKLNYE